MKIDISFDKESKRFDPESMEENRFFVKYMISHIKDIAMIKGYIYESEVYEAFLMEWNPHLENHVWIKEDNDKIHFRVRDELPRRILISMNWPDSRKDRAV